MASIRQILSSGPLRSYIGYPGDFLGLEVDVAVTPLNAPSVAAAS